MMHKNIREKRLNESKKPDNRIELRKQIQHTHTEKVTKKIMQWYKPLKNPNENNTAPIKD